MDSSSQERQSKKRRSFLAAASNIADCLTPQKVPRVLEAKSSSASKRCSQKNDNKASTSQSGTGLEKTNTKKPSSKSRASLSAMNDNEPSTSQSSTGLGRTNTKKPSSRSKDSLSAMNDNEVSSSHCSTRSGKTKNKKPSSKDSCKNVPKSKKTSCCSSSIGLYKRNKGKEPTLKLMIAFDNKTKKTQRNLGVAKSKTVLKKPSKSGAAVVKRRGRKVVLTPTSSSARSSLRTNSVVMASKRQGSRIKKSSKPSVAGLRLLKERLSVQVQQQRSPIALRHPNKHSGDTKTALEEAACTGDYATAHKLLSSNPPGKSDMCTQALFTAAARGHKRMCYLLIQHDARLAERTMGGKTAAHLAIENRHFPVAEMILDRGPGLQCVSYEGDDVLLTAIKQSTGTDFLHFLFRQDINLNWQNNTGNSALMVSVLKHNFEAMKCLMDSPYIKLDLRNTFGDTAEALAEREGFGKLFQLLKLHPRSSPVCLLLEAIEMDCLETVVDLLGCKFVDAKVFDPIRKTTPLNFAIERGVQVDIVKALLANRANVRGNRDVLEYPLTVATKRGCLDIVKLLVEKGAKLNHKELGGKTALMFAAQLGHLAILEYLISQGADLNIKDGFQETALAAALLHGQRDIVRTLLTHKARCSRNDCLRTCILKNDLEGFELIYENTEQAPLADNLLLLAVDRNAVEVAKMLISYGADVNVMTNDVFPLSEATSEEMTKLLIDSGADVNAVGIRHTALHQAVKVSGIQTMEVLLSHGADINKQSFTQNTPLLSAIFDEKEEEALFLIKKGADVNLSNSRKLTPLMISAQRGLLAIAKALLEKGADFNATSINPIYSALMYASMNSHVEVVKCLLEAGSDVNAQNPTGETALHMTIDTEVLSLLVMHGADVDHENDAGETPLLVACKSHRKTNDFVTSLIQHGAQVCTLDKTNSASPLSAAMENITRLSEHKDLVLSLLQAGAPRMLLPYKCPTPLAHFIVHDQGPLVKEWVQNGGAPVNLCVKCLQKDFCVSSRCSLYLRNLAVEHLSPLAIALSCGRLTMARYLTLMGFLTWEDVTTLKNRVEDEQNSIAAIFPEESRKFLREEFLSELPSLKLLSFIKVTAHLKWDSDREAAVRGSGLPRPIQDQLLFQEDREKFSLEKKEGKPPGKLTHAFEIMPDSDIDLESDPDSDMSEIDSDSMGSYGESYSLIDFIL